MVSFAIALKDIRIPHTVNKIDCFVLFVIFIFFQSRDFSSLVKAWVVSLGERNALVQCRKINFGLGGDETKVKF